MHRYVLCLCLGLLLSEHVQAFQYFPNMYRTNTQEPNPLQLLPRNAQTSTNSNVATSSNNVPAPSNNVPASTNTNAVPVWNNNVPAPSNNVPAPTNTNAVPTWNSNLATTWNSNVATPWNNNVAAPSNTNVAAPSNTNAASVWNNNVPTSPNSNMAAPSNNNAGTPSLNNVVSTGNVALAGRNNQILIATETGASQPPSANNQQPNIITSNTGNQQPPTIIPSNNFNQQPSMASNTGNQQPEIITSNTGNQQPTFMPSNNFNQQPTIITSNNFNQQPSMASNTGNQQPEIITSNTGNQQPPTIIPSNNFNQQPSIITNTGNQQPEIITSNTGNQQPPTIIPSNNFNQQPSMASNTGNQQPEIITSNNFNQQPTIITSNNINQQPSMASNTGNQQPEIITSNNINQPPTIVPSGNQQPTFMPSNNIFTSNNINQQPSVSSNTGNQQLSNMPSNTGNQEPKLMISNAISQPYYMGTNSINQQPTFMPTNNINQQPTFMPTNNVNQTPTLVPSNTGNQQGFMTTNNINQQPTFMPTNNVNQPPTLVPSNNVNQQPTFMTTNTINQPSTLVPSNNVNQPPTLVPSNTGNQQGFMTSNTITQPPYYAPTNTVNQQPSLVASNMVNPQPTLVPSNTANQQQGFMPSNPISQSPYYTPNSIANLQPTNPTANIGNQQPGLIPPTALSYPLTNSVNQKPAGFIPSNAVSQSSMYPPTNTNNRLPQPIGASNMVNRQPIGASNMANLQPIGAPNMVNRQPGFIPSNAVSQPAYFAPTIAGAQPPFFGPSYGNNPLINGLNMPIPPVPMKKSAIMSRSMWLAQMSTMGKSYAIRNNTDPLPDRSIMTNDNLQCEVFENSTEVFRQIDGSCNNVIIPTVGQSFRSFKRYLNADYSNIYSLPRTKGRCLKVPGENKCYVPFLPSPRLISRVIHTNGTGESYHSLIFNAWAQFVSNDLSAIAVEQTEDPSPCCGNQYVRPCYLDPTNKACSEKCFPISISQWPVDPHFKASCMEYVRSLSVNAEISIDKPREQLNLVTPFLDASTVYGSDKATIDRLRTTDGGTLKKSAGDLLPEGRPEDCVSTSPEHCFEAGDERVNQSPELAMIHLAMVNLHNMLAEQLIETGWDGDRIFQETKKIISAYIQKVTYTEFLPEILDQSTILMNELNEGIYDFEDFTDPRIANVFSAAAFQFIHSLTPDSIEYDASVKSLTDLFNNPGMMFLDTKKVATYMANTAGQPMDRYFSKQLTDHYFENGNFSFDLVAQIIQTGRDHGLPSYNEFRTYCGLLRYQQFFTMRAGAALNSLYHNVDDVDVFVGGMLEDPLPGSMLGPTFSCIIARQFRDTKFGDSHWYETTDPKKGFNEGQLDSIKAMTAAKIICDGLGLPDIPKNPFRLPSETNPLIVCADQPGIDFKPWFLLGNRV